MFLGGVVVASLGAWATYWTASEQFQRRLVERGEGLANTISYAVASSDQRDEIEAFVKDLATSNPDIVRITLVSRDDAQVLVAAAGDSSGRIPGGMSDEHLRADVASVLATGRFGHHVDEGGRFLVILAPLEPRHAGAPKAGSDAASPSSWRGVTAIMLDLDTGSSTIWNSFLRFLVAIVAAIAAMMAIAYLALQRRVLRPLALIRETVARQEAGDRTARAPVVLSDEIGDVAASFDRMLDRIAEGEQRFHDFAESAADWFYETDEEFRLTFRAIRKDVSQSETFVAALGRRPWDGGGAADPERDPGWAAVKAAVEARLSFRDLHYSVTRPDGSVSHRRTSGRPFYDTAGKYRGYRGTVTDETSQIEAQRRAEHAEMRLRDAIEVIPEGFIFFDADDRLMQLNSRALELYPLAAAGNVHGARFEDILRYGLAHGQYLDAIGREEEWLAERLRIHRELEYPIEQRLAGGRWLLIDERRTRDGGWVGTRTDITALKARENELRLAKEAAEVGSKAKSEFLANMSHELRTPLNAIIGFSDLIEREVYGPSGHPNYRQYAANIQDSGRHLLAVLNDILDLSKIEAGKLALVEHEIDLAAVVASVVRILAERAAAGGIIVKPEAEEGLPLMRADERALRQILLNLLSNSIKFTSPGGLVTVSLGREPEGGLAIVVADSGIGIAAEDLPRALEPFGQIDGSLARRHEGTGLGLPIARKLTEAMDGIFEIESATGAGTRVTLRFPPSRLVDMPAAAAG